MTEPVTPEETPEEQTAEFKGETFRLNTDVSEYAFLEFAEAAEAGEDSGTLAGMAALMRFLLELIHDGDRARFRQVCRREKVTSDELVDFMLGKAGRDAERPTERSSDSSDGPTGTAPSSDANSDVKDSPPSGLAFLRDRPDLALVIVESQAHEARRRAS